MGSPPHMLAAGHVSPKGLTAALVIRFSINRHAVKDCADSAENPVVDEQDIAAYADDVVTQHHPATQAGGRIDPIGPSHDRAEDDLRRLPERKGRRNSEL